MTESQIKFQKERDRANKILETMTEGCRYKIGLDSEWSGEVYYRGRGLNDSYFCFSKKPNGRRSKLPIEHLVSATKELVA